MAIGVQVWSQTPATNATADTNVTFSEGMAPSQVNDSCRSLMGSVAKWRDDNNGTIATSGTSLAFTVVSNQIEAALTAGFTIACQFHATADVAATLAVDGLVAKPIQVNPGTNLVGQEIQANTIQRLTYSTTGTGQWIAQSSLRPVGNTVLTAITNAMASDVTLSTTSFFDGPSVAQGTTGVWYASGTITYLVVGGGDSVASAKLWDGTNVIAATQGQMSNTILGPWLSLSLSGVFTNPPGNIRISSCTNVAGSFKMVFNPSGASKDSSVTAIRIG